MDWMDTLQAQLIIDEGKRNRVYTDTVGIPTIGIGHNLQRPISDKAIQAIFDDDIAVAIADAKKLFKNFEKLSDARKAVVCNMSFQLGYDRLSLFRNMIAFINNGNYSHAADAMLDSRWSTQTPLRAMRLANLMRTG